MGHSCSVLSKSKKPIVLPPNPTKKESQTKENKQAKPNMIPDDEDEKQEENEKNFGEYEANDIVINKIMEKKNCKRIIVKLLKKIFS